MAFKQKGFPTINTSALKHGKLKDFQSGKKGHNPDKMSAKHEDWHLKQSGEGKPFKMKSSPMKRNFGVGADSPMKETTTQTLQGMSFQPYAHQTLRAEDIPSFRDMVSLEQQQAARKAWKAKRAEKRAKKREAKEWEKKKEAGAHTLTQEDLDYQRSETGPEPVVDEVTIKDPEVNVVGSNPKSYIY